MYVFHSNPLNFVLAYYVCCVSNENQNKICLNQVYFQKKHTHKKKKKKKKKKSTIDNFRLLNSLIELVVKVNLIQFNA